MASKEDIKKVILEVAGNPESGVVPALADKWADAIVELDNPTREKQAKVQDAIKHDAIKETRITKPEETR